MDSTLPHFKDSRSPVRDDIFIVIDTSFSSAPLGATCVCRSYGALLRSLSLEVPSLLRLTSPPFG